MQDKSRYLALEEDAVMIGPAVPIISPTPVAASTLPAAPVVPKLIATRIL
jgi:hypothetical protein